jgi:hypothetical protein
MIRLLVNGTVLECDPGAIKDVRVLQTWVQGGTPHGAIARRLTVPVPQRIVSPLSGAFRQRVRVRVAHPGQYRG